MSKKDGRVEEELDRFADLSYNDKQHIIEGMEGDIKTDISRQKERFDALFRGLLMGVSGVLAGFVAGISIRLAVRGGLRGTAIGLGITFVGILLIMFFSWLQVRLRQKQSVLFNNDSNDEQSPQAVTVNDVDSVFDDVQGPAITSTDVTKHLSCTRESAQKTLKQLNRRDDIDHRKVGRRELWWRTDSGTEHDID